VILCDEYEHIAASMKSVSYMLSKSSFVWYSVGYHSVVVQLSLTS